MKRLWLASVGAQDNTTVSPSLLLKHLLRSLRLGPSPTQRLGGDGSGPHSLSHPGKSEGDFPDRNVKPGVIPLTSFGSDVSLYQRSFSNVLQRLRMWGWICDHESCFRSLVFTQWTGAVATTEKPHEIRSSDARRTPEKSLGNCVTERAAVHLTSSSSLFVHCNETCGHLRSLVSASYRVYGLREWTDHVCHFPLNSFYITHKVSRLSII